MSDWYLSNFCFDVVFVRWCFLLLSFCSEVTVSAAGSSPGSLLDKSLPYMTETPYFEIQSLSCSRGCIVRVIIEDFCKTERKREECGGMIVLWHSFLILQVFLLVYASIVCGNKQSESACVYVSFACLLSVCMLFPERITQTSNRTYEYVLEKIIA